MFNPFNCAILLVKRKAFVIAVFCFTDSFAVGFYFVNFAYIRFSVVANYWRLLLGVLGAKFVLKPMDELTLYKFIYDNDVELRWDDAVLSTWVPSWSIKDFADLMPGALDEGGIEARLLQNGTIWVDLVPICDRYGIDPEKIHPKQ